MMLDVRVGWSGLASVVEKRPRVMVVDDDPEIRRALRRQLIRLGYQTRMASSAEEADSLLPLGDVDVVLLDIALPRMNGVEFLEWTLKRHPELPVIMLTASDDQELAVQCLEAGARTYLVKPVQPDFLRLAIDDAVALKHLLAVRNANVRATAHN